MWQYRRPVPPCQAAIAPSSNVTVPVGVPAAAAHGGDECHTLTDNAREYVVRDAELDCRRLNRGQDHVLLVADAETSCRVGRREVDPSGEAVETARDSSLDDREGTPRCRAITGRDRDVQSR